MEEIKLDDFDYMIAAICEMVENQVQVAAISNAIGLAMNGAQFDTAIQASIKLDELITAFYVQPKIIPLS